MICLREERAFKSTSALIRFSLRRIRSPQDLLGSVILPLSGATTSDGIIKEGLFQTKIPF